MALGVVVLVGTAQDQRVIAEDCAVNTAAFAPGTWSAGGISFAHDISDSFSAGVIEGEAGFTLHVGTDGIIAGSYSAVFSGSLDAISEDTSSEATIVITGELGGTAADVQVNGEASYEIGSSIDVSGADGVDLYAGQHPSFPHNSAFTRPFNTVINASFANCAEAIGNLSQDPERPIIFIATRATGDPVVDADISGQAVEFIDAAQNVFANPWADSSTIHDLIREGEEVDALVAAQQYCEPENLGSLAQGGSSHEMYRETLIEALFTFIDRAALGEFATAEVISAFSAAGRGASFGGLAGDCVDPVPVFQFIRTRFEDVLLQRLDAAAARGDTAEVQAIQVAAAQFAMDRIDQRSLTESPTEGATEGSGS